MVTTPPTGAMLRHIHLFVSSQHIVDVTGDRSKVRCCKEQYCIGTWNVRSMNQGKLVVVKRDGKSEH